MTQFTDGQTRVIETLQMRADDLAKAVLHFIPKSEHRTTLCRMLDALATGCAEAVTTGDGE